jgi:hypothetical protein
VVASATPAAIRRLMRIPCSNVAWLANSAPKTATASAPPSWRLVLNTPLAVPARDAGTLFKSTAVTGGETNGPASPTRTISAESPHTGVAAETRPMVASPAVIRPSPLAISARAPNRSAIRAVNGVRLAPISIIGRNATPVANEESPCCCCR